MPSPTPANHGVVERFHELAKMSDGEGTGDFTALLTFSENLSKEPHRYLLRPADVRRTDGVHCAGQHDRLPQRPVGLGFTRQPFVEPAQALGGSCLAGKF